MSTKAHVVHKIERVASELVEALGAFPASTIHESNQGRGALHSYVKPIRPSGMKVCGSAVTVQARPGDNLIIHKALAVAGPGDVLVVTTCEYVEAGIVGEVMARAAMERGIVGLVTDGGVRDTEEMTAMGFPVFSKGISIKGTTKSCLGTINHSIIIAGVTVNPGDVVVGDSDGVVVVAADEVPGVIERSGQREEKEKSVFKALSEGETTLDRYGFDNILGTLGLTEE